nr:MAG TPA: hypothetical protein [Caudoviricetes sp.]
MLFYSYIRHYTIYCVYFRLSSFFTQYIDKHCFLTYNIF